MKNPEYCRLTSCPFALTDESEQIQNYGCLPAPFEIIQMRVKYGKTWACHKDATKLCLGAIEALKERKLPFKVIDSNLVTVDEDWSKYTK